MARRGHARVVGGPEARVAVEDDDLGAGGPRQGGAVIARPRVDDHELGVGRHVLAQGGQQPLQLGGRVVQDGHDREAHAAACASSGCSAAAARFQV